MADPRAVGTQFVRGVAMGAADVVPGVSGGTVALLLGVYEQLVGTIRDGSIALGRMSRGEVREGFGDLRRLDWWFLAPLVAGMLATITALAGVIQVLLENYPEELAGLFLGLVAASLVVAARMPVAWSSLQVGSATLAAVVLFVVLGFSGGPVADPSPMALFGAGAVAVCAWILPGISGAFLLLMLGMYPGVLDAVDDGIFGDLAMVAAGAVVGLALFSMILGRLLERHRDTVLAVLVGLMAGSLRVLWPWPNGVGVVSRHADKLVSGTGMAWPTAGDLWPPLVLAGVAFVVVLGLHAWSRRT